MMKRLAGLLCLLWLTVLSTPSMAAGNDTIHLEDDVGCDAVNVQQLRVQLTRIIMTSDNEQAKDQTTQRLLEVTKEHCIPLTGIFEIKERTSGLLRVETRDGVTLWLVE